MAQTIVIEQGSRLLQDVEKVKPDTRVNYNASDVKYPTTDLNNGMTQTMFTELNEAGESCEFYNPDPYVNPDQDAADDGETGETESGETESGETESGESV